MGLTSFYPVSSIFLWPAVAERVGVGASAVTATFALFNVFNCRGQPLMTVFRHAAAPSVRQAP